MIQTTWEAINRVAILKRLEWLNDKPQGLIYKKSSRLHNVAIGKVTSHIHLMFLDPTSEEIQSRIDLNNPLYLLAPYTQAMILGLLWSFEPIRVYVVGFGGGRIPMLLHHYYQELTVESTEIDEEIVEIAKRYFGIAPDSRLQVIIKDGREYLSKHNSNVRYDIIIVDAFRGTGYGPYHLATREFYSLCNEHLREDGVVVVNLLSGDSLYYEKIKTMMTSFKEVYFVPVEGTNILFCSNGFKLSKSEFFERALLIQDRHKFPFPFLEHVANMKSVSELDDHRSFLEQAGFLTDSCPPQDYFDSISRRSSIFKNIGRNEDCPCGSGKKFKRCHGR
jgi:spermidine synthase